MIVCGVDEVGVSSIAAGVFACAVVMDTNDRGTIVGVADSKQLSRQKREELAPIIESKFEFAFGAAGPREIERINIYWARYAAMRRAVKALLRRGVKFDRIIVDGNRTIPDLPDIAQEAHPKADVNFFEVSCASILAKVRRDNLMLALASKYKHYSFETNCGYYTPSHRRGIIEHGPTPHHRKTFKLFKYCMASREEYEEFLKLGGKAEEFFISEWEDKINKKFKGFIAWKKGLQE